MAISLFRKLASITQSGDYDPAVFKAPTVTTLLSGSGTYTTPAAVKYLKIKMVGGGAGGPGGGPSAGTASQGTSSTFGAILIAANAGGSNTINSPAVAIVSQIGKGGGSGGYCNITLNGVWVVGGAGGATQLGGHGQGGGGSEQSTPPLVTA